MNRIVGIVTLALLVPSVYAAEPAIQPGLVVVVDCKEIPHDLCANETLRVHCLTKDASSVQRLRETLLTREAGDTVSVDSYNGRTLPYIDNLVNLILAPETTSVSREEMLRVLAPLGRAVIGEEVLVKPWPKDIDEWSHFLYDASNNAVSNDQVAGAPKYMQWLGVSRWARNHDKLASTSAIATTQGRIYFIMDNGPVFNPEYEPRWRLEAIDAFNGLPLWSRPMKSWVDHMRGFRSGPVQIARLLVAHEDTVYTTLGLNEPVVAINGKNGETLKTYENTQKAEEILYHDGKLLVVVSKDDVEQAKVPNADFRSKAVKLIDTGSGDEIWRWPKSGFADIVPTTLTASGQRVFLQCGFATLGLDLQSGQEQWRDQSFEVVEELIVKPGKNGEPPKTRTIRSSGWTFNTVVVAEDIVLSSDLQTLVAISASDGDRVWSAAISPNSGQTPSEDIFVIDGVVWTSPRFEVGRDLRTGEVVKTLDLYETMVTSGHHHRCYRNRAVGNSIVFGHRGMEFFDTVGENHSRNNWVRGVCQWGIMPANGLMYAPPHDCSCYPEAILHGFWALAPDRRTLNIPDDFQGQLERGPAYGRSNHDTLNELDWPTYRQNAARGGVSAALLPPTLRTAWSVPLGKSLTAPVVADNTVLLASKENKTVYAIDAATGRTRWRHVAGGIVDSPPTVVGQRVLFGAADGTVTCLSLDDGALMWRFHATPAPYKAIAMGELESLWPVNGSVLVKNGIVYFTAGRSSYLDGGLFLFGLSADTGEVRYRNRYYLESPSRIENARGLGAVSNGPNIANFKTFESSDKSDAFSMVGNTNDVMVADEDSVYLRHMRFNDRLEPQDEFRHHLFSTSTLLDPHEAYRSHWIYGNGDFSLVPVSYEWLTRIKNNAEQSFYTFTGSICVHDGATLWGVIRTGPNGTLVAYDIQGLDQRNAKDFGEGRRAVIDMGYDWAANLPFHPRAMAKAGPNLYVAGGADVQQILGEAEGGILQTFSAANGGQGPSIALKAPPVFDGMAVGNQALFVSLVDGSLVCLR